MSKTKPSLRPRLSLLVKFSLASFCILAVIAIALAWGIQQHLEKMAVRQEAENAAEQVQKILTPNLRLADMEGPLDPARHEEIDALIRRNVLSHHLVRIKIWNRDGVVVYSDEKEVVGRRFPVEGELKEALVDGKVAMEISDLKKEENVTERGLYKRLIEIYVPLRPADSPQVAGAYEVYHDLSVLESHLAEMRLTVWGSIALGFVIFYGSLFWTVRNASRELIRRNDENTRLYEEVNQQLTELKRTEGSLRESEDRYRDLVEHSQELICTHDLHGRILSINPWAVSLLGYDTETLLEMNIRDILCPKVQHQFDAYLDAIVKEGTARGMMLVQTTKGEERIWEYNNTLRKEGVPVPIIRAMARDITERKRAEKEVQRNYDTQTAINSILRLSLENIPLEEILKHSLDLILSIPWLVFESRGCIFLVEDTPEVLVMKAQNGLAKPIQMSCAQVPFGKCLCGRTASTGEIYFADHIDDAHEIVYEGIIPHGHYCVPIMSGGVILGVLNIYVKEGHPRNKREEEFLTAIANTVAGIIVRNRGEKEMAALQEQFRQSQKMEAIGQLAGGIAHDFNNLLTVISGYSEFSLRELKEDGDLRENIEEIKKAARRASDLTRQLLAFSRRQILEMEVLDLNTVLGDLDKMLCRMIGEHIELVITFSENLGRIKTDRGQIEQVIMNLAINARDAMPSGGKIIIGTTNVELDEDYAHKHTAVKPGRYVMLSVSDTGVGMTPEVRDRVFEPFFTTKGKGKGTGLGLSTVYGIVKQSGGNIWVYSEPGHGTTFKIYLPIMDEPFEEAVERKVSKELPRGSETVLIVEDDKEVRMLAMRILKTQGYRVLEASEGREALRVLKGYDGLINLLLTDVVMPEMSGRELANRLTPSHPKIKVLFMSGYTDNAIVHHGVLDKGVNYIQKPFTVDGLARKVREVLDN